MSDSAIIGLFPSEKQVARLPQLTRRLAAPPHGGYHVTLAYVGDLAEMAAQKDAIVAAVSSFALKRPEAALHFGLGPLRLMENVEDGDLRAVAATVEPSPDLRGLQAALVELLAQMGIAQKYPEWLPHLTIGYQAADLPLPRMRTPRLQIACPWLHLCWGDERLVFPLGGALQPASTKPFVSNAQRKWAFATEQPFARRWARMSRRKLPEHVRRKEAGAALTWTDLRLKFDESKVDRDDTGKFSDGGGGGGGGDAPKSKPKPKKAPKQTPEERQAAQAAEQAENRSTVGDVLNANDDERLSKRGLESLAGFADGKPLSPEAQAHMEKNGLIKTDRDGVTTLTAEGRKVVAAANKGDADAVGRALDDAGKRAAGAQGRAAEANAKRAAVEARRAEAQAKRDAKAKKKLEDAAKKPKGGGGGGKGPKVPEAKPASAAALNRLDSLLQPALGTAGKARKPAHRYWRAYREARKAGALPHQARRQARQANLQPRLDAAERQRAAVLAKMLKATAPGAPVFTVFKEKDTDRLRWIIVSSNGYEDRDREIVSTKALAEDVARTDVDGLYGPLRWWHVGDPDPMNFKEPWGPGLDLGMCDWADMHGPFLIESGTFYDDEVGAALAEKADDQEVSLGFFHPANEPDARGVFSHIRRFERSLAPKGRVSNLLTGFYVPTRKEIAMNDAKLKALAERLQGVPTEKIEALIGAHTASREKEAQAQGLRFKAGEPQPVYQIEGRLFVLAGDQLVAVKAPLPPEEEAAALATKPQLPEAAADAAGAAADAADAAEDAAEGAAEGDFAGDLSVDDFRTLLVDAMKEALAPLLGQLKMADKMEGMVKMMGEEMKGMLGGVTSKDDARAAEIATLKAQQAALAKKLAELSGETPRALKAGSEVESTAVEVPAGDTFTVKSPTDQKVVYKSAFDMLGDWVKGEELPEPAAA